VKKEGGSGMGEGRMDLGRMRKAEINLEGYGERKEFYQIDGMGGTCICRMRELL
jgi:hypothetical protein